MKKQTRWPVILAGRSPRGKGARTVEYKRRRYLDRANDLGGLLSLDGLRASAPQWSGIKCFDNHAEPGEMRNVGHGWLGVIVRPFWHRAAEQLRGEFVCVDPAFASKLEAAKAHSILPTIALSIDGNWSKRPGPSSDVAVFESLLEPISCDVVAEGGLGGHFLDPRQRFTETRVQGAATVPISADWINENWPAVVGRDSVLGQVGGGCASAFEAYARHAALASRLDVVLERLSGRDDPLFPVAFEHYEKAVKAADGWLRLAQRAEVARDGLRGRFVECVKEWSAASPRERRRIAKRLAADLKPIARSGPKTRSGRTDPGGVQRVKIQVNSKGDNFLVKGSAGKSVYVLGLTLRSSNPVSVRLGDSGNLSDAIPLGAGDFVLPERSTKGVKLTTLAHGWTNPGQPLILRLSKAAPVSGVLVYRVQ